MILISKRKNPGAKKKECLVNIYSEGYVIVIKLVD